MYATRGEKNDEKGIVYMLLWESPSGELFYYSIEQPEFDLSDVEGALDEAGEYQLYIVPFGDGVPFTYGGWTSHVTQ